MTPRSVALSIVARVAVEHRVPVARILGRVTLAAVCRARHQAYCDIAFNFPSWSISQIAKFFDRHHSSVISSFRKFGYPHNEFRPPNGPQPARQLRQDLPRQGSNVSQVNLLSSSVKHGGIQCSRNRVQEMTK